METPFKIFNRAFQRASDKVLAPKVGIQYLNGPQMNRIACLEGRRDDRLDSRRDDLLDGRRDDLLDGLVRWRLAIEIRIKNMCREYDDLPVIRSRDCTIRRAIRFNPGQFEYPKPDSVFDYR